MKNLLALMIFAISTFAHAEMCTSVMKNREGFELERFTRNSYDLSNACNMANDDCEEKLSYQRSRSWSYYSAYCEVQINERRPDDRGPYPRPNGVVCQTDLVNKWGEQERIFTAPGINERDACNSSDNLCKMELARNDRYGSRCINRGLVINRNDPRPPRRRTKTEECTASRLDPAGMFIQSYQGIATGPIDSDVYSQACRQALQSCSYELRGRQTCQITNK